MGFTGVARHQVQQHPDAPLVSFTKQVHQVGLGAVTGGYLLVIPDIVAGILEGGVVDGVEPQGVAAQALDIVQLFGDAVEVTDAIAVGVLEGLGVDFVKDCVFQPGCAHKIIPPFLPRGRVFP